MLVPTAAYRDESTSYHYIAEAEGDYIGVPTEAETAAVLDKMGLPYKKTCI